MLKFKMAPHCKQIKNVRFKEPQKVMKVTWYNRCQVPGKWPGEQTPTPVGKGGKATSQQNRSLRTRINKAENQGVVQGERTFYAVR